MGQAGIRGEAALVDWTSARCGEEGSYYSAVCLKPGGVESIKQEGNSNAESSAAP